MDVPSPNALSASVADRIPDRIKRSIGSLGDVWTAVILLGLVVVFAITAPPDTFLTFSNLRNVALNSSEILILASGATFVLISAGIDLSVGSLVIFSGIASAQVMTALMGGGPVEGWTLVGVVAAGIAVALLSGTAWGVLNGSLSVAAQIPSFIVTLGTFSMALGFAQIMTGGFNVAGIPRQLQGDFASGSFAGVIPWPVIVAAITVTLMWLLLSQTRFGVYVYAIGSNVEAARRAGINVSRYSILVYVLMGFLCGEVAMLDISRFGGALLGGQTQTNLAAIAAVVIGGTSLFGGRGHMGGTVIGAFIPAVLLNGLILLGVQSFWQNVAVGAILIVAVYIDQVRRRRLQRV